MLAILLASPCAAQMVECAGVRGGTSYKVLVDEVQFATETSNQAAASVELIQSAVDGALEKVRQRALKGASSRGSVSYLTCKGRHPSGDGDFSDAVVGGLAESHATLELWGTLFSLGGNNYTFDIHYVMFPITALPSPKPSAMAKTQQKMAGKPTADDVQKYLIKTRDDLPVYFTLAAGVQAFQDRNWDQAVRYLCEARTNLKRRPEQQDLTDLAGQYASKAAAATRQSADASGVALLTEAQARDYCAFATTR